MHLDKKNMNRAGESISMSPGEMVRTLRELKGWSQNQLAQKCKISQTNLSGIENNRIQIGKERAIALAQALNIHPGSIMFADYSMAV
jgi:transcriptional regulator with XRE-family HTH domain